MSFFAHGKDIKPATNYLVMMSRVYVTWEEEERKKNHTHTKKTKEAGESKNLP